MQQQEHKEWSGKTDGTPWMQRALITFFRYMPLWLGYAAVACVIPFYMLFNRKGYKACFKFFRQAFGYGRIKSFGYAYLNHFRFGQIIIDRFAKYAGKQFRIINMHEQLFADLAAQEESFVVLSAHIGNYEMAGYALHAVDKPINAIVYGKEAVTVMQNRQSQFVHTNVHMIPVAEDMSHLFLINNALRNGEIVSIPADRLFGSPKAVECSFFGHQANLPMGPFATVAQRDVPAIAVFVLKSGYRTYNISIFRLTDNVPEGLKRADKISLMAQRFADAMQEVMQKYPTQWFNYYDFWRQ